MPANKCGFLRSLGCLLFKYTSVPLWLCWRVGTASSAVFSNVSTQRSEPVSDFQQYCGAMRCVCAKTLDTPYVTTDRGMESFFEKWQSQNYTIWKRREIFFIPQRMPELDFSVGVRRGRMNDRHAIGPAGLLKKGTGTSRHAILSAILMRRSEPVPIFNRLRAGRPVEKCGRRRGKTRDSGGL